ncbi:signal peptidase II [Roseiconus nitratireducens]|uniref:Lipoprotein signal peptidase n=1 Tax=Roseiconus nitratireducens TaxID=2605748 RepID=A0A5M6DAB2_9BACT|nr:signal peptidase II [Roseiconus nitratireducens]KAA5544471.1 signal peptidase II [Roseiconus nitratireducens]
MNQANVTADPPKPAAGVGRKSLSRQAVTFITLALLGGAVDLWTKAMIFRWRGLPGQNDIWWVIKPYFGIETAVNIGAVFGMGAGKGTFFAAMSVIAAIGIVVWLFWFRGAESWWLTVALGLVGGGIIGNLYDRLGLWWQAGYPPEWQSGVRDWILWQINARWTWPNFNIADSLLVVGAGMLLYQSFFPGQFAASESSVNASPEREDQPSTAIESANS